MIRQDAAAGRIGRESEFWRRALRPISVLALPLLLTTMRLSCWPFEVEGRDAPPPPPPPVAAPAPIAAAAPVPDSLPRDESVRYDVRYGVLGTIGELVVSAGGLIYPRTKPEAPVVSLRGVGHGAVLGLGGMVRRIDAEFDVRALGSRRWTEARRKDGQRTEDETIDVGERDERGHNRVQRRVPGKPDETQSFFSQAPTSDLLGMIWRLRTKPPALGQVEVALVLDGLALWQVTASTVALADPVPEGQGARALKVEGKLLPIDYNGAIDPKRTERRFTMWLDARPRHVPLRLEVPVGPGDVVLQLVEARPALAGAPGQVGAAVPGARNL